MTTRTPCGTHHLVVLCTLTSWIASCGVSADTGAGGTIGNNQAAKRQGAARAEPFVTTLHEITDDSGRRVAVHKSKDGQLAGVEVFDSSGKKVPVRKMPLGRALFCLPVGDGDSESGPIDVTKYDCRRLAFVTEGAMVKTEGEDPCVTCGGDAYCY